MPAFIFRNFSEPFLLRVVRYFLTRFQYSDVRFKSGRGFPGFSGGQMCFYSLSAAGLIALLSNTLQIKSLDKWQAGRTGPSFKVRSHPSHRPHTTHARESLACRTTIAAAKGQNPIGGMPVGRDFGFERRDSAPRGVPSHPQSALHAPFFQVATMQPPCLVRVFSMVE
jgi:hypothetical protein